MIKKKYNIWEQFFKNFSVTYIGYGKFLYYHRNPRTKKIKYGKIDFTTPKAKLALSSLISLSIVSSFLFVQFRKDTLTAKPHKTENSPKISHDKDSQITPLLSAEELHPEEKKTITGLILEESRKLLDASKPGEESRPEPKDKGNTLDQEKLKSLSGKSDIATSIDDEDTEKLKRSTLLSDDTRFIPEQENKKVKIYQYTVKKGDSVGSLARKFGISADTIGGSSGKIMNMDEIWPGLTLSIPSRDGILYKMKKGETLAHIANRYGVALAKILAVNAFDDPDNIPVGNLIFLPDIKPRNLFTGFLWPVGGRITSLYGWRRHPFVNSYHFHEGLDLSAPYVSVRAAKSGKVTFSGWMGSYGMVVILSHPNNYKTMYAHNSRLYVRVGQYVRQGQVISQSGSTGRSTGPHVHFEIWKNNRPMNPLALLRKR